MSNNISEIVKKTISNKIETFKNKRFDECFDVTVFTNKNNYSFDKEIQFYLVTPTKEYIDFMQDTHINLFSPIFAMYSYLFIFVGNELYTRLKNNKPNKFSYALNNLDFKNKTPHTKELLLVNTKNYIRDNAANKARLFLKREKYFIESGCKEIINNKINNAVSNNKDSQMAWGDWEDKKDIKKETKNQVNVKIITNTDQKKIFKKQMKIWNETSDNFINNYGIFE